ncbi:unnamed protein product [Ilex paraguariensis]|uniref:Uncharacterized protein n=1 Tax=Ilex paraguariensis TaxID=185542 RepID=A0ABC8RTN3_9AQUA
MDATIGKLEASFAKKRVPCGLENPSSFPLMKPSVFTKPEVVNIRERYRFPNGVSMKDLLCIWPFRDLSYAVQGLGHGEGSCQDAMRVWSRGEGSFFLQACTSVSEQRSKTSVAASDTTLALTRPQDQENAMTTVRVEAIELATSMTMLEVSDTSQPAPSSSRSAPTMPSLLSSIQLASCGLLSIISQADLQ